MESFCHTPRHTESVTKVHLANLATCYTRFASLLNVQSRAESLTGEVNNTDKLLFFIERKSQSEELTVPWVNSLDARC